MMRSRRLRARTRNKPAAESEWREAKSSARRHTGGKSLSAYSYRISEFGASSLRHGDDQPR